MTATFFPIITSNEPPAAPPGWEWRLLGEVAQLKSGHTPSRRQADYWEGGDVHWLSLKDIKGLEGRYVVDTANKPTQKGIDNTSAPVLPKGTVAFCRTASVGKVVILGRDMATSQDFANWVCGPDLLPEYLYEALRASGGQFNKEKQGSTHKTIYMPTLERFRVLLPPLSEQRRIADILDKADAIRRKRKEAIALTEELLRSAFLEMFGDPVTNPKGWDVKPLGEMADVNRGKFSPRPRNDPRYYGGRFPFIQTGELRNTTGYLRTWKQTLNEEGCAVSRGFQRGTVAIAIAANIGDTAIVDFDFYCPDSVVGIWPRESTPEYLEMALRFFQPKLIAEAPETAQKNINLETLRPLVVPAPPHHTQAEFGAVYRTAYATITRMMRAELGAGELFSALVHRAFRGELAAVDGRAKPHHGLFKASGK